jgi:hypothetical protein
LIPPESIGTVWIAPVGANTASAANVPGGVGIVSVWPGIKSIRMSASSPCMVSCGYLALTLPPANPLG